MISEEVRSLASLCKSPKEDIVDGPFGSNLKRDDYVSSGIPVLKIQNVKESGITLKKMDYVTREKFQELERHSFRRGDIVITKLGDPLGIAAQVDSLDEGLIVADLIRIRVDESLVDKRYLTYRINSAETRTWLNGQQRGTTRPRVTLKLVREIPISLPPLDEQKRIVAKLDETTQLLDSFRENQAALLQKRSSLLMQMMQSIFSKSRGITSSLNEVARLVNGRAYAKDELLNSGKYRVLRVGNFFGNKAWYWSDLELAEDKYCESGDLLYAWSASFGPRFWDGERSIYHYHIWKVVVKEDKVLPEWLYWWFLWDVEQVKAAAGTGTTMMHVTKRSMEARTLLVPDLPTQIQELTLLNTVKEELEKLDLILESRSQAIDELRKATFNTFFGAHIES